MKSLAELAGIPIEWNENHDNLIFGSDLLVKEKKFRLRHELSSVLPDENAWLPGDAIQYWMYNGISLQEHTEAFAQAGIQYELTLLFPGRFGAQRSKTLGHIHSFPPNSSLNYAEVCEVIQGEAYFVFETLNLSERSAPIFYAVHARQGDKVVFPPNLHHLTINAGDDMLLFSDLICVDAKADYVPLSAMQGAAYLYGESDWMKNPVYQMSAPLKIIQARPFPNAGLTPHVPLYDLIIRLDLEQLSWLCKPEQFLRTFPELADGLPLV